MPINIYRPKEELPSEPIDYVAWLCDGEWELPTQISALETWLEANADLPPDIYIADIGYSVREGAMGGGGVFTVAMMQSLVALGMEVWFSEYPWGDEDEDAEI